MKLHLKIIEADNIPKMDLFGKADPYVSVHLSESKDSDKTKYIEKTYSPKWNKEVHLRVSSISEDVTFELKDHDPGGKVDMIGTIERKIKQFQPGIINDEWITVKKAKGAKKTARIHIISHLALEGMTPFVQMPFQFLKVCVNVISASDIEKMDTVGKTDPYVVLWIQSCPSLKQKTSVLKNNMRPRWNEEFTLDVLNQTSDILSLKMWDKGGKIQLKIQVIPLNETKWAKGVAVPIAAGQEQQIQSFMEQMKSMQSSMIQSNQTQTNNKQPSSRQIETNTYQQQIQSQQQFCYQSMEMQQSYNQSMQQGTFNQAYQIAFNQTYQMPQQAFNQTMVMQQSMYQQGMIPQQPMYPQTMPIQQAVYNQSMALQQAAYPPGMMMQQGVYNQGYIPPPS